MTTVSRVSKAERKAWARETFLGAECSLLPSFKPGSFELDEEGVRHDVRQGIGQGFYSMFCASVGLEAEERKRFLEVAADEAGDRILLSTGAGNRDSISAAVDSLRQAEAVGCSHVMLGAPRAASTEEMFSFCREVIDSTDLGIVLYAQRNAPIALFRRLAALPNVVGVKVTQVLDAVTTYEVCEQLGEQILVGPVNLEHLPFAAAICPIQCTMMWQVDACQSPEQPYVVQYLKLLAENRTPEAIDVFKQMAPLVQLFWDEQAAVLREGGHPWEHLKYHSWCGGANGGPLRSEAVRGLPPLSAEDRRLIRETYTRCGITPREPEEEFDAGRVNFAAS
jgi:4-hydroxy-tetrahydrodipicolinate synthase